MYFATFPSGCFDIIAKHLKSFKIDEIRLIEHDESSVTFESSLSREHLIELRYFTNIYQIIDDLAALSKSVLSGDYFSLGRFKDGIPEMMSPDVRQDLEKRVSQSLGLTLNTHKSKNDFYMVERKSGKNFLTLRLPRAKFKRDDLAAGELRPELANILCLAAGVKAKNVVLDPFAGYGAIPYEAVRGFGCKRTIAVDVQQHGNRHKLPAIEWHQADAANLSFIQNGTVDRVVTDPPWGKFDAEIKNLDDLYTAFVKELHRVLKPDGIAIVLSGYDDAGDLLQTGFNLLGRWNILVSGKKAAIFKLQRASFSTAR